MVGPGQARAGSGELEACREHVGVVNIDGRVRGDGGIAGDRHPAGGHRADLATRHRPPGVLTAGDAGVRQGFVQLQPALAEQSGDPRRRASAAG